MLLAFICVLKGTRYEDPRIHVTLNKSQFYTYLPLRKYECIYTNTASEAHGERQREAMITQVVRWV